ncbi:hypothetical protein [Hyalangium rubrum]|uniref:Uncharacterized protein n=1 Tax=Hyalangium rubrum TaxID=3103134 RepID=A0ABU5GXW0_9BACT|nr:hypothetical protein [Hyalangium sp. s54d21]MDY7226037.1 hypothetical protein [Hyalangium sp. s54d21]
MLTALLALSLATAPSVDEFFREPERVQIFLAELDQEMLTPRENDTRPRSGVFLLTREGPELKKEDREALSKIWVPAKDHTPRPPRKCMFNPDIALRFWRGKTWVDAVVCFSCEQIAFRGPKGEIIKPGFLDDFSVLHQVAKQAFPDGSYHKGL